MSTTDSQQMALTLLEGEVPTYQTLAPNNVGEYLSIIVRLKSESSSPALLSDVSKSLKNMMRKDDAFQQGNLGFAVYLLDEAAKGQ